jgi:hypothetical protein
MTVAVGVALAAAIGVRVGVVVGPAHPASHNPHTPTISKHFLPHFCLKKWGSCPEVPEGWIGRRGLTLIMSFIVLNTGRIFAQAVVQ